MAAGGGSGRRGRPVAGPAPPRGARRKPVERSEPLISGSDAALEDIEDHPCHSVEVPWVVGPVGVGVEDPLGEGAGEEHVQVGGHAIGPVGAGVSQAAGQVKSKPALHAGGGHDDPLGCHRVR